MSSNPGYRRDYAPRGGYNRGGRGGGAARGGFNKPSRRYWDNDDFSYKDKRDNRRRHSRSRSRSYSRSRSHSLSPPRQRRNSRPDEYSRNSADIAKLPNQDNYEQYVPQPASKVAEDNSAWKPASFSSEYGSQYQTNGSANKLNDDFEQQILRTKQKYQIQQSMEDPSLTFGGYGYSTNSEQTAQLYQPQPPVDNIPIEAQNPKKKKEKRKKKKSRRRSSSSSSSSSNSSSPTGSRKKRKSKRGTDDSSEVSSGNDTKNQKEKTSSESGGSRITDDQRQALLTQHNGYKAKLELLEREISKLQTKEDELKHNRADPRLIDENLKLQAELKGRCKAVDVVLEKINNVLVSDKGGAEKSLPMVPPPPPKLNQQSRIPEVKLTKKDLMEADYIDNGQHWCRLCNVFPETYDQMLKHFHSDAHRDQVEQLGIDDKPWHKRNPPIETANGSSGRKLPLRGMQFFSPVEGWYCRLCNIWMGDQHCASDHLKSVDHNANYMTFLEEHPDWETKWNNDREKARLRALDGKSEGGRKSRFNNSSGPVEIDDGVGNPGSIRVQMRNTIKVEDHQAAGLASKVDSKDTGIDEWMGKPQKVALDIIDTQKFAEIVRQRHGAIKKDDVKSRDNVVEQPRSALPGAYKDKDFGGGGGREVDKRRFDRVEMQIPARDNRDIRDRYRDSRALRGGGRRRSRSRSRSRSRERDRGFHGRRRSRSRERDNRRDRDNRGNRDRVDPNKKMPMIGKMPLYKRKDKDLEKESSTVADESAHVQSTEEGWEHSEEYMMPEYADPTGSALEANYEVVPSSTYQPDQSTAGTVYPPSSGGMVPATDIDLKPPGEKEAPGGTNLPDDLQHALDIIYRGGGPITVPPPNFPGGPMGVPPPYPGFLGYEQTFFTSSDMEEVSFAGNEPKKAEEKVKVAAKVEVPVVKKADAEPENDGDDLDDLRMLGIDVDDVAVVSQFK